MNYGERSYIDEQGRRHTLVYRLVDSSGPEPRYGLSVEDSLGDRAFFADVTSLRERGEQLLEQLQQGLVTPVTLRDVLEDLL